MGSALIIIDLQNDFLAPSAPFKVDSSSHDSLKSTLSVLVPEFRSLGGYIIWVKSHYAKPSKGAVEEPVEPPILPLVPQSEEETIVEPLTQHSMSSSASAMANVQHLEWVIEGTHTGKKPCCQEGTFGAELVSWSDTLRHPNDLVLIKTYFSAFKETNLEQVLVDRDIGALYFAGLLSNMCVLASSLTAVRLSAHNQQWDVNVLTNALAWRREQSHHKALETLEGNGVQLVRSEVLTKPLAAVGGTQETIV